MNLPPFPEGFLPRSPEERLMLVQWGEQCRAMYKEDAERLAFAMQDIDGFVGVEPDKYDFAMRVAIEMGHDEPTREDELEGLRRLIDAARSGATGTASAS